jgi:rhomboid protease GluP
VLTVGHVRRYIAPSATTAEPRRPAASTTATRTVARGIMCAMGRNVLLGLDPAWGRGLRRARRAPVTLVFLAACVALFVVAERHGSTEDVETLVRFGATERGRVWAGEWWRLVTAAFLHVGAMHLGWNVLTMLGWCPSVERRLGSRRFAVLYLGAAIAGSATSVVLHDVVAAGASGAGFGIVGAWLALDARRLRSWRAFVADRKVRRVAGAAALWTVALAAMHVDHAGHLGGFVAGGAITWALTLRVRASRDARRRTRIIAAAAVVLPVLLAVFPRSGTSRYGVYEAEDEVDRALEAGDLDTAERVLARVSDAEHDPLWIEYTRALVRELRGDLAGAAAGYDALAHSPDPRAQQAGALAAKVLLAHRLMDGDGMERDVGRARALLREACASGKRGACEWLDRNPEPALAGDAPASR